MLRNLIDPNLALCRVDLAKPSQKWQGTLLETVDPRIAEIALEKVQGSDFEKFCQGFFSATFGTDYVPLGGVQDGGADGLVIAGLFEAQRQSRFMQASVRFDTSSKIKSTIKRLKEFGREPKTLLYATSQKIRAIDKLENELSEALDVRIAIRDQGYFIHHINDTANTKQAFQAYLAPVISYLAGVGKSNLVEPHSKLPSRTLCVFIGQELDRHKGKTQILEAVTDSLILWSLEETDPEEGRFLSRQQIVEKVVNTLPAASTFFLGNLSERLQELTSKSGVGRKINYHRKEEGYCLPYEIRRQIKEENVEDETLRIKVSDVFKQRALRVLGSDDVNSSLSTKVSEVCHKAIHRAFHEQGLEVSVFVEGGNDEVEADQPAIQDHVDQAMVEHGIDQANAAKIASAAIDVLHGTFYQSTPVERKYLQKLCRTYVLMFMLKNEPRVVEYFREMSGNFDLYVGADLVVRCLSEHMLAKPDQMTRNAFALLRVSGSKLILTDKTLDEVWHHLRTTNYEYDNNYSIINEHVTPELARQISKILIRSYFYGRFTKLEAGQRPMNWYQYLGQFITVKDIENQKSRDEIRAYLMNAFGFEFEPEDEMMTGLDTSEVEKLSSDIFHVRAKSGRDEDSEKKLCRNAAATVLRVYHRRSTSNELAGNNPFGYRTWWLTGTSASSIDA